MAGGGGADKMFASEQKFRSPALGKMQEAMSRPILSPGTWVIFGLGFVFPGTRDLQVPTKEGKKKRREGIECLKWAEMNANGQFGFLKCWVR